nr:unnamed protein product [Digitaria exilis]
MKGSFAAEEESISRRMAPRPPPPCVSRDAIVREQLFGLVPVVRRRPAFAAVVRLLRGGGSQADEIIIPRPPQWTEAVVRLQGRWRGIAASSAAVSLEIHGGKNTEQFAGSDAARRKSGALRESEEERGRSMGGVGEKIMVSALTGVMRPVLGKLTNLIEKKYTELKNVRKKLELLREELMAIDIALEKYAAIERPDVQVKAWVTEMREMAYDMEDIIDQFTYQVDHEPAETETTRGKRFFSKKIRRLKKLHYRYRFAGEIKELLDKVKAAKERRERHKIEEGGPSILHTEIDPRLEALYVEVEKLVGIGNPRQEVIGRLVGKSPEERRRVSLTFGPLVESETLQPSAAPRQPAKGSSMVEPERAGQGGTRRASASSTPTFADGTGAHAAPVPGAATGARKRKSTVAAAFAGAAPEPPQLTYTTDSEDQEATFDP